MNIIESIPWLNSVEDKVFYRIGSIFILTETLFFKMKVAKFLTFLNSTTIIVYIDIFIFNIGITSTTAIRDK